MESGSGVPRGFGVSAYLSELYMREIDNEIKALPDVIYYARYVDDIVIIFSPKTKKNIRTTFLTKYADISAGFSYCSVYLL